MAKLTIAGLQADLDQAKRERDAAEGKFGKLEGEHKEALASVERQASQLEAARKRAREDKERIEGLDAEVAQLGRQLRAYKGSATKARAELTVLKAAKSDTARNIGPDFAGALAPNADDGDRRRARLRFEDAIRVGPTTLVFSDGRREIRELAPLIVDGGAWRETARGFNLDLPPEELLEPGEMAKPLVTVAGFGLLDESGEQIAWQELVEAIDVPRLGRVQLPKGTIRFEF